MLDFEIETISSAGLTQIPVARISAEGQVCDMQIRTAGTGLSVAAGIGAGAALVLWPYAIIAQIVLGLAGLLGIVTVGWFIVELFIHLLSPLFRTFTLLGCGIVLGVYITFMTAYFSGYLTDAYPVGQKKIAELTNENHALSEHLTSLQSKCDMAKRAAEDAKTALADPLSISKPAYSLETSVRLQFNGNGNAKEIAAHNLSWSTTTVKDVREVALSARRQLSQAAPSDSTCIISNIITGKCESTSAGLGYQFLQPSECPAAPRYETLQSEIFFLSFLHPISARAIRINTFDDELPEYKLLALNSRIAIILFTVVPKKDIIEITVEQEPE
ncbi:hypothetical protein [Methylocella silvestris]|uniref:hypothetical protein n=1 Tax=Methylocella silvestris TaxID=199596 RepID=UPI0011D05142|nr:hypothetical protein [Methylocella silvestris]